MGTFIRTWRAEWAGLSRAQLAIAVNGNLSRPRRISGGTVQRWEEGQPPKSTEELEALCGVMRKHGLIPLELKQFRQAVFAACADRQFPELFPDDEWIHRDDVDVAAHAVLQQGSDFGSSASIVDLLASVEDLSRGLDSDQGPRPSAAQRQRQRAALFHLRTDLARTMGARGRSSYAARLCAQQVALLEAYPSDSPLFCQRDLDLWRMYHELNMAPARGPRSVQALLDLVEQSALIHGRVYAAGVFAMVLGQLGHGTQEQRDYAWRTGPKHAAAALGQPFISAFLHWQLSDLALRTGHTAQAEPLLEPFQSWRESPDPEKRRLWAVRMAAWARVTEDYPAELGYLGEHVTYCRQAGRPEGEVLAQITRCEADLQKANRRKRRTNSTSKGKTRQSGKKRKE